MKSPVSATWNDSTTGEPAPLILDPGNLMGCIASSSSQFPSIDKDQHFASKFGFSCVSHHYSGLHICRQQYLDTKEVFGKFCGVKIAFVRSILDENVRLLEKRKSKHSMTSHCVAGKILSNMCLINIVFIFPYSELEKEQNLDLDYQSFLKEFHSLSYNRVDYMLMYFSFSAWRMNSE